MSEKKIELITKRNNSLEITEEALKFLLSLKNQNLIIISINGPSHANIFNELISKNVLDLNEKNDENIFIWTKPIDLVENYKLIIFDYGGNKNNDLFLLNILIANYYLYFVKGDLNDELINTCVNDINIKDLINFKNNKYMPEIFFANDKKNEDELKKIFENNSEFKKNYLNNNRTYKSLKYLQIQNRENLINLITNKLNSSNDLKEKCIDGESLFGLIQNIINSINHNEKIDIDLSYENILLNKARNDYEKIFEEYKLDLYKKIEYPINIQSIYKTNLELLNNYTTSFCQKINLNLTPSQANHYLNQFNISSEKEISNIISKNNDYYEMYFLSQFEEVKKNLDFNFDLNKTNFNDFITNYCGKFESCLLKILNMHLNSENNYNKIFANVILKMFQEFFVKILIKISGELTDKNKKQKNEYEEKINELNNNLEKIKEELNNEKKLLENKDKEKSDISKNYFELETKFDRFNRDYKMKLKENENSLNIEIEKYSKMEKYYLSQLKEKETQINSLENKIEKINKEMQSLSKENSIKINELNRENNRLLNEVELIKEIKNKNGDFGAEKNINVNSILKSVNKNFLDFKESIDNLKNENNSIQKNKYLELTKEEIDSKLNNVLNDVKNFCTNQIKTVSDNYEKIIKKVKNDFEELNFELSKKDFSLNEQLLLKETYEKKFNESNKMIEKLKSIAQDKDNLINTQKSSFAVYENRINDVEMKYAESDINLRMKEEELDNLLMIIQYMFMKKADKFEQNLSKISPESRQTLKNLVKNFKIFK